MFDENYEFGLLEYHSKNLKLFDKHFSEKNLFSNGDALLHEILYFHKNYLNVFFIALRSDTAIYFHNALQPEVKLIMPLPEYQNNLFYNKK